MSLQPAHVLIRGGIAVPSPVGSYGAIAVAFSTECSRHGDRRRLTVGIDVPARRHHRERSRRDDAPCERALGTRSLRRRRSAHARRVPAIRLHPGSGAMDDAVAPRWRCRARQATSCSTCSCRRATIWCLQRPMSTRANGRIRPTSRTIRDRAVPVTIATDEKKSIESQAGDAARFLKTAIGGACALRDVARRRSRSGPRHRRRASRSSAESTGHVARAWDPACDRDTTGARDRDPARPGPRRRHGSAAATRASAADGARVARRQRQPRRLDGRRRHVRVQ